MGEMGEERRWKRPKKTNILTTRRGRRVFVRGQKNRGKLTLKFARKKQWERKKGTGSFGKRKNKSHTLCEGTR